MERQDVEAELQGLLKKRQIDHQGNIHADAWVSVTRTLKAMESGTDHIEHALNKFPAIE